MRAGYLLDEPVPGEPFDGVPGQVSTVHGTQHTDMSYSYVQRGGTEEFHPFDYLGFRYFQIDDPGETLGPADVVARARHTAVPDEPAATFSSDQPVVDADLRARDALGAVHRPGAVHRHADPGEGPVAVGRVQRVVHRHGGLRRAEPDPQVAARVRRSPRPATGRTGPSTRSTRPGSVPLDINEFTEIYPEWVWQYWMHTGDRALLAAVYRVLGGISDYVQHSVSPSGPVW